MDETKAREILGEFVNSDNTLGFEEWKRDSTYWDGGAAILLHGGFSANFLEAIIWWMRNKAKSDQS